MPNVRTYLEYNNPLAIIYRSGTSDDPFIPKSDSMPVINNLITLLEVPSQAHGVQITGFTEITEDKYKQTYYIGENEFLVNYSIGNIQFNPVHDGKTITCNYMSRGLIMYPASRIYTLAKENPDIVVTLQDYIDTLSTYQNILNLKLDEINQAITRSIETTNDANAAIDNANTATKNAQDATEAALDAAATTYTIRKPPVNEYSDLATVYPNPENGWQVTLNTTGDIYRFNGSSGQWELVGNLIGGAIPYVSAEYDGILKKEDYKNFVTRPAFFSIQKIISKGVQPVGYFRMPSDGKILNVEAYCTEVGLINETEIAIDRISKADFENSGNWDNIFSQNLIIEPNTQISSLGIIADTAAFKDDLFRVNVSQYDDSVRGISIIMTINTTFTN